MRMCTRLVHKNSFSRAGQSDFQSGVNKQNNQLTLEFMGQNLALCKYMLKVVHSLAFDTTLLNNSSFISPIK